MRPHIHPGPNSAGPAGPPRNSVTKIADMVMEDLTARGLRVFPVSAASGEGTMPLGGPIAARNVAALRFVGGCNYRPRRVRYIYHRWLDEKVR